MGIARRVIPFAVSSKDRRGPLSYEIELASVFSLTEAERDKGGGVLRKRTPEKVSFISPCLYPIFICVKGGKTVFFDGLDLTSTDVSVSVIEGLDEFEEDVKRCLGKIGGFLVTLSDYEKRLDKMMARKRVRIEGLIGTGWIHDLYPVLHQAKSIRKRDLRRSVVLKPSFEVRVLKERLLTLANLKRDIIRANKRLENIIALTRRGMMLSERLLKREIDSVERRHVKELRKVERVVEKKVDVIKKRMDAEIDKVSKKYARQNEKIYKACRLSETTIRHLEERIRLYEWEAKIARKRGKEEGEKRWMERRTEAEKKIAAEREEVSELYSELGRLESDEKSEISKIRLKYSMKVRDLRKKVEDLKAAKEAEIGVRLDKIREISDVSSKLMAKTDAIIDQLKDDIRGIDAFFTDAPTGMKTTLLNIPLYMVRYENKKERLVVYLPAEVAGRKTLAGLRLWGSSIEKKMRSLMKDRFRWSGDLIARLIDIMEKDVGFRNLIVRGGGKLNILSRSGVKNAITRGLIKLRREGWLTDKDFSELETALHKI